VTVRVAVDATGRAVGDHVCWPYQGPPDLLDSTMPYLAEGFDRRELVVLVTDAATQRRFINAGLGSFGSARQLVVLAPEDAPGSSATIDGIDELLQMTRDAVRSGWAGVRMLADVTSRIADDGNVGDYLHWEHRADHVRFDVPYTTMCAYDETRLESDAVGHLACLHPVVRDARAPFRLVASRSADAALAGALDASSVERLRMALDRIGLPADAVLDAHEVDFVHHRVLLALDDRAATSGGRLRRVDPPALTDTLVELLQLRHVEIGGRV
jgi:hypothetical protein